VCAISSQASVKPLIYGTRIASAPIRGNAILRGGVRQGKAKQAEANEMTPQNNERKTETKVAGAEREGNGDLFLFFFLFNIHEL
jgi:hypothetical protein